MQKFLIDLKESQDGLVVISGQDARHMGRVLRLKPGDPVAMTDGRGRDYTGKIETISPDRVQVSVVEEKQSKTESDLHLTVCSAMLKDKKMDGVIKQLTQLGVSRWIPFSSSRSVPSPNSKKISRRMERWETIARESLKQCRRSCLVDILPPMEFGEVLALAEAFDHKIAFWEEASCPLGRLGDKKDKGQQAIVLIGPEGGFSESEILKAEAQGFVSYSLGPRILRAETAASTAAGLVQYILGDMGGN